MLTLVRQLVFYKDQRFKSLKSYIHIEPIREVDVVFMKSTIKYFLCIRHNIQLQHTDAKPMYPLYIVQASISIIHKYRAIRVKCKRTITPQFLLMSTRFASPFYLEAGNKSRFKPPFSISCYLTKMQFSAVFTIRD